MKTIREFERDEILALTPDELEDEIRKVLAEDGIKQLPPSPKEPECLKEKPAKDAWRVNAGEMIFESKEVAEKVAAFISEQPRMETYYLAGHYDYGGPEGIKPVDSENEVEARPAKYWEPAQYDTYRSVIKAHREAKSAFDKERESYESIKRGQEDVRTEIEKIVKNARQEKWDEDRFKDRLEEYEKIADGDRDLAWKFLCKAHYEYDTEHWRKVAGFDYDPIMREDCCEEEAESAL
jgi:hypothetical protein